MLLNSSQVLDHIDPDRSLDVRSSTGDLLFVADPRRIQELCQAGQVAASARGRHIRYLELIVPLDEVARAHHPERSYGGLIGEDSRTVRRGEDLLANVYSHDAGRCAAYGGSREAYLTLGSS